MRTWRIALVVVAVLLAGSGWAQVSDQIYDTSYQPTVASPAYAAGAGPLVLLDEAHNNYHTKDGRYHVFAELLANDGYRVEANTVPFSAASLAGAKVLVIANALNAANVVSNENWRTPIQAALTGAEIQAVVQFVRDGGSLLLVADHMPFPGAIQDLAANFGIIWQNAFAFAGNYTFGMAGPDPNLIRFRLGTPDATGGIAHNHAIYQGRSTAEAVAYVSTFTGSAFRLATGSTAQPLMELGMGGSSLVMYPMASQEISQATPMALAMGLLQGATLEYGRGRVAFIGEAAMLSARLADFIAPGFQMGMNNNELAPYNKQFTLNLAHWLTGIIPAATPDARTGLVATSGTAGGRRATKPVTVFSLQQNSPNPFNPETQIQYSVAEQVQVRIDVFNALGQRVRTLVRAEQAPGTYTITWDGRDDDGQALSGGVYMYKMKAGSFSDSGRMVLAQ